MLEKKTERNVCYMDKYQPKAVHGVGGGAVVKIRFRVLSM